MKKFLKLIPSAMGFPSEGICEACGKRKDRFSYFFNRDACCKKKKGDDYHDICHDCAKAAGKGKTWEYVGGGTIALKN
jgi:hypothetical protein